MRPLYNYGQMPPNNRVIDFFRWTRCLTWALKFLDKRRKIKPALPILKTSAKSVQTSAEV